MLIDKNFLRLQQIVFKIYKMSKSRRKMMRDMRREAGERRKTCMDERNGGPSPRYSWQEQVEQGIVYINILISGELTT
jgi:hypothetical protein